MNKRIYALLESSKNDHNGNFDQKEDDYQFNKDINIDSEISERAEKNPFRTPNNASKRLLEVIKNIELKYLLNDHEYEDYNCFDISRSSCSSSDNENCRIQSTNYKNDEVCIFDSPVDDQDIIQPHQSRLNMQFQRITKIQETKKIEIQQIKKKIEHLDREYEFMDNVLDLSF